MKKGLSIVIFLLFLFLPVFVFASGSVTISSTSLSVVPGKTTTFNIVANNSASRIDIVSSDTSIVTVNKSSEWLDSSTLTVTVTGKKTGNAKITVAVDGATYDEEVIKKTYTINVRVKSTNNSLSSLSLSNGTLSPSFNSSTTSYTSSVDAASTVISAKVADSTAKVSGTGTKSLKYGKNTFNVVVTSEAGTTKTYVVVITRKDTRSNNAYLKSLSTNVGNISFKKDTTTYNLNVATNIKSASISATLEDSKASFVSGYGPRTVNLNYGKNAVVVKVKAENGSIKTYTINITREDNRSTNNLLSSLTISNTSIVFDKNTFNYNISVPYEITNVTIDAIAEDSRSKVVVNNRDLIVGDNIVTIVVTSENGAERIYTLNIKRLTEAEKMSDNNNVSTIDIFGHDFELVDGVYDYDVKIASNENSLIFNIDMEDDRSNYIVEGNENIKDGSVVTIKAISESGIEKEYKFHISKESIKSEDSQFVNYLLACFISLIIGFVIGFGTAKVIDKVRKNKRVINLDTLPNISNRKHNISKK